MSTVSNSQRPESQYTPSVYRNHLFTEGALSRRYQFIRYCTAYTDGIKAKYPGVTTRDAQELIHRILEDNLDGKVLISVLNSVDFVVYLKSISDFNAKQHAHDTELEQARLPTDCPTCRSWRDCSTSKTETFETTVLFQRQQDAIMLLVNLPLEDKKDFVSCLREYLRGKLVRMTPSHDMLRRLLGVVATRNLAEMNPDWTQPTTTYDVIMALSTIHLRRVQTVRFEDHSPHRWFKEVVTDSFVSLYDQYIGHTLRSVCVPGQALLAGVAAVASMELKLRGQFLAYAVGIYVKPDRRERGHKEKLQCFDRLIGLLSLNTFQYIAVNPEVLDVKKLYEVMTSCDEERFPSSRKVDFPLGTLLQMYSTQTYYMVEAAKFLEETLHICDFVLYLAGDYSVVTRTGVHDDYQALVYPVYKLFLGTTAIQWLTANGYMRHLLQRHIPPDPGSGTYYERTCTEKDGVTLKVIATEYCKLFEAPVYDDDDPDGEVLQVHVGEPRERIVPVNLFTRALMTKPPDLDLIKGQALVQSRFDTVGVVLTQDTDDPPDYQVSILSTSPISALDDGDPDQAEQVLSAGTRPPDIRRRIDRRLLDWLSDLEPKTTWENLDHQYDLGEYAHGVMVGRYFRFDRTWLYDDEVVLDDGYCHWLMNGPISTRLEVDDGYFHKRFRYL